MKKFIALYFLLLMASSSQAQRSRDVLLEDSIFSWKTIPKLKTAGYSRKFTPAQLKHPELFAQWLQKSYKPLGALDFSYAVAEPNKKDEVQPHGTGINAAMWRAMWDNSGTKVIRQPHSENPIWILTNVIIDAEPIHMLTTPGQAVFKRRSPQIEQAFMGSSEYRNKFVKQMQLEDHPQIGKYIIQYFGCDGDACQPLVAVYLAPGNRLPIRQLSRGEVLGLIEKAIPTQITVAKNKLKSTFGHRPSSLQEEYNRFEETVLPKWKSNLDKLKKKYAGSMHIPAEIRNPNGIEMINIFNGDDIFAEEEIVKKQNTYGIYTYEEGVLEKSIKDQPLWVCISWKPADMQYLSYEKEMHRSMTSHFNFDYIYNHFFNPKANNGKPYAILNEEAQKAKLASFSTKSSIKPTANRNLSTGTYFFEDFAGDALGQKAANWYMPVAGMPSVVEAFPGEPGKWLRLGQSRVMPVEMKKGLPENFTMEFEAATGKDFTENTGGAFLLRIHNKILSERGDYKDAPRQIMIDLDSRSSNAKFTQNPTGYTRLKATYSGMNSTLRHADVLQYNNDFSNRKNKVHFSIVKKGNKVSAFIDGKEIISVDKYGAPIPGFNVLPEGTKFTSFYFENITNASSKHLPIYISNIKIKAL